MTKNNKILTTTIFSLVAMMLLTPLVGSVVAEPSGLQKAKNIISDLPSAEYLPLDKDRVAQINSELTRSDLSKSDSDNYRAELNKIEKDLKLWFKENSDPQKRQLALEKKLLIADNDEIHKSVPITGLSYDHANNALEVTIHPKHFKDSNLDSYIEQIRAIIGDEIDLTLSPSDYAVSTGCSNRNAYCDEPEGGMQFAVGNGACTIGFRATLNGDTGFVTAGHCVEDEIGSTAYMPTPSGTDIGIVTLEVVDQDSNNRIYCDCGFVETDEDDTEMSDNIFGTANPNSAGAASLGSQVAMSGQVSGVVYGYVLDTEDFAYDEDLRKFYNLVKTSYTSQKGDSGGPVINSSGSTLHGIQSLKHTVYSYSWYVQEDQIRKSVSNTGGLGISWDF